MPHFDDLKPNDVFGRWSDVLVSVGWLDDAHDYPRGIVSPEFFRALVRLLVDPWQPGVFPGRAPCALCRFSGGPGTLAFEGSSIRLGSANLFVPGPPGTVFVAPSLVAHTIDAHGYAPPEVFQQAVLQCPPMRSAAYLKALPQAGLHTANG